MTLTRIILATFALTANAQAQDTSDLRKSFQSATSGSTFNALQSRRSNTSTELTILGFAKSAAPVPPTDTAQEEAKPAPQRPVRERRGKTTW
ncbi:MAG: hypothetical protein ABJ327_19330 [Litoreibacter sp.]